MQLVALIPFSSGQPDLRSGCPRTLRPAIPIERCTYTFYVSTTGSDFNTGKSIQLAWRTLARVNTEWLKPGACVYLQGSSTFFGQLKFAPGDAGNPSLRVTIGSYGRGRAVIASGNLDAIVVYNTAGIVIQDLDIYGSGSTRNEASGVLVYTNLPRRKLDGVTVQRVDASQYGVAGITVNSRATDGSKTGFSNVLIQDACAHDNAEAGVHTHGLLNVRSTEYSHHNIRILRVHAFQNKGSPSKTYTNTGSGICVSDVQGAVIENCKAYRNGELNSSPNSGPIGIWAYDANNVVIQHCESYMNRSGNQRTDGMS